MKAWMSSNFGKFATELRPLIDVRIEFLLNILKTNRAIKGIGLGLFQKKIPGGGGGKKALFFLPHHPWN